MNYNNFVLFTVVATFALLTLIYKSAFKNGKPQCNNFVVNVYLYLALALSIVGCFIHLYNYILNSPSEVVKYISREETYRQISKYMLISIIITLLSVIYLSFRPLFSKNGYVLNHFIWLVFLSSISLTLYPYFKAKEYSIQLQKVLLMVILIFLFMSGLVFIIPQFIKTTYAIATSGLLIGLLSIIVIELFLYITGQYTKSIYNIISYIVILLFSLFISYDTYSLFMFAKICINSPNYPLLSTNLFLDIINLFVRLLKQE